MEAICNYENCTRQKLYINNGRHKPYYKQFCKLHLGMAISKVRNGNKGDRYLNAKGYVLIRIPNETGSYTPVLEHRYIMEKRLGRKLKEFESVHHKNGIRDDNRDSNLELWVGPIRSGQRAIDVICPHCNKSYTEAE